MSLNLQRNTKVYITDKALRIADGDFNASNTWELPVLEGFTFSQAQDSTQITVNEAGASPIRGSTTFNTSLQPAEWSLSTYIRSYVATDSGVPTDSVQVIDAIMWHALASNQAPAFDPDSANTIKGQLASFNVDFASSNAHVLRELEMYFKIENVWYQIDGVQVNQAEIDFSIDGIGQVTWTGQGTNLTEVAAPNIVTPVDGLATDWVNRDTAGTYLTFPNTATYIKNKLSTISLTASSTNPEDPDQVYSVPVTGGNLTITNNITFLTPSTLSVVDKPIGSFTGARQISGSLTCYLNTGAGNSASLLKALADTSAVKNSYALVINAGGETLGNPVAIFSMPYAHLSVPAIESADVIGLNIEFAAQGQLGVDSTDELTVAFEVAKA